MNAALDISSGSKLLANPTNPALIITAGTPSDAGRVSEHPSHYTVETIRERAETVTPLLKEILEHLEHSPRERWGINE